MILQHETLLQIFILQLIDVIDEKKQYPRILWIVLADWSIMAINIINSTVAELFLFYFCFVLLFSSPLEAKRKAIEEIPRRQLDALITTEDYLAVFWRKSMILYFTGLRMKWFIVSYLVLITNTYSICFWYYKKKNIKKHINHILQIEKLK